MQGVHLGKYGVARTIDFELYDPTGVDLYSTALDAADIEIQTDGANFSQSDNASATEDGTFSLVISIAEMTGARVVIKIVDVTGTKAFLDKIIVVETYGNASAQHAFDLDTASVAQGADNNTILSSLTVANGSVEADLTHIHGNALSETTDGWLAAAFKKLFNVETPVLVASDVMVGTEGAVTSLTDITNDKDSYKATGFATPTNITAGTIDTVNNAVTLAADQAVDVTKIAGAAVATGTAQIGVNVVSEDNIDFGATKKLSLNAATPDLSAITNDKDSYKATSVTVSDKAGFSLSTAGILAIWHQLTAAVVTASTMGKLVIDYLNAAVGTRATSAKQDTMETTLGTIPTVMKGTDNAALASVLGSAAGASISADIVAVKAETASIQVETTALDTLTKASGDGDLAAILVDTDALDTLTKADGNGDLAVLLKLGLCDEWIDYDVSPARRHVVAAGTSTPDLLVQELFTDKAASAGVTAVTDTIIRAVTV